MSKHGELTLTKESLRAGLAVGRKLLQEEWAHPKEKEWVDELVAEGVALATPWEYKDNFQCERRVVTGVTPSIAPGVISDKEPQMKQALQAIEMELKIGMEKDSSPFVKRDSLTQIILIAQRGLR